MNVDIDNSASTPLYYLGNMRALNIAEINILSSRTRVMIPTFILQVYAICRKTLSLLRSIKIEEKGTACGKQSIRTCLSTI